MDLIVKPRVPRGGDDLSNWIAIVNCHLNNPLSTLVLRLTEKLRKNSMSDQIRNMSKKTGK